MPTRREVDQATVTATTVTTTGAAALGQQLKPGALAFNVLAQHFHGS
jgi:hypothetical protein